MSLYRYIRHPMMSLSWGFVTSHCDQGVYSVENIVRNKTHLETVSWANRFSAVQWRIDDVTWWIDRLSRRIRRNKIMKTRWGNCHAWCHSKLCGHDESGANFIEGCWRLRDCEGIREWIEWKWAEKWRNVVIVTWKSGIRTWKSIDIIDMREVRYVSYRTSPIFVLHRCCKRAFAQAMAE